MNTSKLLITSLLAAAAMSAVPAYGAGKPLPSGAAEWAYEFDASTYKTVTTQAAAIALISGSPNYYVDGTITGLNGSLKIGGDTVTEGKVSGVVISDANSGTQNFDTNITGTGVFAVYYASTSGTTYNFTKDVSGFSGDFFVKSVDPSGRPNTLKFSGTGTSAVSGTGNITSNCNVEYAVASGDVTVANASISVKNLTFGGGANYTVSSAVTGNNTPASNNTLTISAGTTTFTGSIANFGTITVASGATADFSNTTFKLGAVSADSVTTTISNSGTVTFGAGTVFDINSYVAGAHLLGGVSTPQSFTIANLSIGGYLANQRGSATFSVSDAGVLTLDSYSAGANYSLTWNGGVSGVWKVGGSGWTTTDTPDEVTFQNGDYVTFGTGTDNNVKLAENLKVGTLTISAATTFTGTGNVAAANLTTTAALTLNGGITLAVTTFASSITANSTVDYSNLSGTGTLSLGLRNDNGVGFDLRNFEGTIRVERGTGVTAASRFQLNTSTLNANARIVVADGNDLVFNDDTNKNVSNSVAFEGSGTIHVNGDNNITSGTNVCTGTLSGNVVVAGTLTKNGDGTLTLSGTSNISALTIIKGPIVYSAGTHTVGSISASGKTLTVSGGSLTISGAAASTIGTLAGTGTLTKTGTGTLTLTPANFSLASLKVGAGTVAFGGLSSASFGASTTIEVSNGGNVDFSLSNKDYKTFSGTLVLKNGGKITKKDGSLVLGDVQLGETSTDTVYLLGDWGKGGTKITGALSGAATVYLANAGNMNENTSLGNTDGERFTISGSDNSYSGTLIVGKQNESTTSARRKTILIVGRETALKNAKVNLALGDKSAMWLGASSVTISGLEGTANSTVALNSDDSSITASMLRVNQTANTTFAGTIEGGIALTKTGAGTLTLSGANTYTGGTVIEGGTLVAGSASALGTTKGVEVKSGATLNLGTSAVTVFGLSGAGTVGLAEGTTSSTLTVNSDTDSTFSGSIGGGYAVPISLVKQGTGTLELSGVNLLYTLVYDSENESLTYAYQDVSVDAGTLRIVTNTQAMTHAGATTVASDAALEVSVSDSISVSLTSVSISAGGKLIIDLSNYASATETFALDIITASALSYNGADFAADCTRLIGSAVELKGWTQTGWTESLAYDGSKLSLTMTIPEPSVFGLLAGLGALALAGTRRRRKA